MVVEDQEDHAELIRRAFEAQLGQDRLTVLPTLAAARSAVVTAVPDLVIADLILPDGKGSELLALNRPERPFPIVIMTSRGDEEAAVEAMKAGALHYVVKSAEALANMPQIAESALREWRHVVERRRAEAALQASERRYRTLYDNTPAMFFTIDTDGAILSANRFAADQLGTTVEELNARHFLDLCTEDVRRAAAPLLGQCFLRPDKLTRWQTCLERPRGESIWVKTTASALRDDQDELTVLMVCEDITEAYHLSRKLSFEASHDPLTSLYNRREFERRLERALEESREEEATHALCYLDLDQFKVINDSCGHLAGDTLLRQLGELLRSRLRKGDCLARLGGDEFGVLLRHCTPEDALHVAESFRGWITDYRFHWEDQVFSIGVSIGVVPITSDLGTIINVLGAADRACYAAKDQGRNRIHLYLEDDAALNRRRGEMQWVARIHRAFDDRRFRLDYQPIVPVEGDGPVSRYEVLVRLLDEDEGLVFPGSFLPAAERYNLIGRLDRWVVETVLRRLASHPRHLRRLESCAINLSGWTLGDETFLAFCERQFEETGVSPEKICFEITETTAITNLAQATKLMQSMKELGCRFALDDFGSGVSSFAYLKRLPVDFLKIDGLFVKDIVSDPIDAAVVRSINEIAHAMGKQTIAEFVEDSAILESLLAMGVDYAQGYHVGRPRPFSRLS